MTDDAVVDISYEALSQGRFDDEKNKEDFVNEIITAVRRKFLGTIFSSPKFIKDHNTDDALASKYKQAYFKKYSIPPEIQRFLSDPEDVYDELSTEDYEAIENEPEVHLFQEFIAVVYYFRAAENERDFITALKGAERFFEQEFNVEANEFKLFLEGWIETEKIVPDVERDPRFIFRSQNAKESKKPAEGEGGKIIALDEWRGRKK